MENMHTDVNCKVGNKAPTMIFRAKVEAKERAEKKRLLEEDEER